MRPKSGPCSGKFMDDKTIFKKCRLLDCKNKQESKKNCYDSMNKMCEVFFQIRTWNDEVGVNIFVSCTCIVFEKSTV